MIPYHLTCDRRLEPMAVDELPGLSWKLESDKNGDHQTAYQIIISNSRLAVIAGLADIWDSGKVDSDRTLDIFPDIELTPFSEYYWAVKAWDRDGEASELSLPGRFETGPLSEADWAGKWVTAADSGAAGFTRHPQSRETRDIVYFRQELIFPEERPQRARLYLASDQACYVHLNGRPLETWLTAPMPRNTKKRTLYLTYDVTGYLAPGKNILAVESASGRMTAMVAAVYNDCRRVVRGTDERCRAVRCDGRRLAPMDSGEIYVPALEPQGWTAREFDDSQWDTAAETYSGSQLRADRCRPMEVRKRVRPKSCRRFGCDTWIFENDCVIVGRVSVSGSAPAGTKISLTLSEKLNDDGSVFYLKDSFVPDVSTSVATSFYTFKGEGVETFTPHFAYSSFQYLEIKGYPGQLSAENVWFETIQTPIRRTGAFSCSNPLFNTLYENMCRTVENDAHDGLGSTYLDEKGTFIQGDSSFAGEAILYTEDIIPVFRQCIEQELDAQMENGAFRSPDQHAGPPGHPWTAPEWDSTALHLTKYMDDHAGLRCDTAKNYEACRRYMRSEAAIFHQNDYLEDSNTGGDWNSPDVEFAPEGGLISGSACNFRSYEFLKEMALWLGRDGDIPEYEREMTHIAEAINRRFLRGGRYDTDEKTYVPLYGGPAGWAAAGEDRIPVGYRQASNLMPLVYGITPKEQREEVLRGLVADICERDSHLNTGCIASRHLLTYLTECGYGELAYEIADQRTYPSWGYWVGLGATTMWEHWRADSRSRDHFFLGAGIQEWLFKSLAGFQNMRDGFRTVDIKPFFPGKLDKLSASIDTVRGIFAINWERKEESIVVDIRVPANTTANILLPGIERRSGSGEYRFLIPQN